MTACTLTPTTSATSSAVEPLDITKKQDLAVHRVERRDRLLERALDLPRRERLVGVVSRRGEPPGLAGRVGSSDCSSSGANLLRRRFLIQKLRAIV